MKFTDLPLKPEILKAIEAMGYKDLTPIQELTIPHILANRDLLASAETGSGKTSACAIPLVQRIDLDLEAIQTLILVPTRELALQYVEEIGRITEHIDIVPFAIYGGFDMGVQKAKLQHRVHILVATPGRLIDFLYRGALNLSQVQTFVLDEADEMMKEGFLQDINFVFSCLIHEHQTLLFSATMPQDVKRLVETYLNNPVTVELNAEQVSPQSLVHQLQFMSHNSRLEQLQSTLSQPSVKQAIIFCNSRLNVDRLFSQLKNKLADVDMIHGGLEQDKRSSIIRRLRNRRTRFMIATDLAGRGLDFSHVSHVINYDFPRDHITYTHRTGRAGRMGRIGTAITFVTSRDVRSANRMMTANRIEASWIGDKPNPSPAGSRGRPNRRGPRQYRRRRT